MEPFVALRIC